ncbi:MAG: Uma2 family endonuclease [Steroidobacteraceae bacterium]|nr:Uma2 family endonuclease [Deltaproteobacteria bacterium]
MTQTNLAEKLDERFTYGQYCQWNDGERWELIDGVPYNMTPAPVRRHQGISTKVVFRIAEFLQGKPCKVYHAPFDVRLPDLSEQDDSDVTTVVQPDLVVICDEKKLDDRGCRGAPDLVVEILSPSTSRKDIGVKFSLYERHGVREYWIIHPAEESLMVFTLSEDGKYGRPQGYGRGDLAVSTVLEGLELDLEEVFAE